MQDQIRACVASERKSTASRAANVPMSRRGGSRLESKKQELSSLDVEATPPSSNLPSVAIARSRKRDSSTSQADSMVAVPIANASEQRPRKRQKRSSSTPPAPRSSLLSTRLSSLRRSRSRAGSPTTDSEHVLPSRASARLARKIFPFINGRNSDIYTHLADPDGAGVLLSEPPAAPSVLSMSNEMVGSQSAKPRGRRSKNVDLIDENAKKDLMEEWARMRQSRGALPLADVDENACFSQMHSRDASRGDRSISSMQLDTTPQRNSADPALARSQTFNIQQSQETTLDVSLRDSFSTRMELENALPMGTDATGEKIDHEGSVLPSDGRTEQLIAPAVGIEAPTTSLPDPHIGGVSPSDEQAAVPKTVPHRNSLQSFSPMLSDSPPLREDSVLIEHVAMTELPINEQEEARTRSFDNSSISLDSEEEFYMLDVPEIFTLPWVPVTSHLYVPPSLGKLISGMREQLAMEARARQRTEELYQAELNRRISAEKVIEDLRAELEERKKDLTTS